MQSPNFVHHSFYSSRRPTIHICTSDASVYKLHNINSTPSENDLLSNINSLIFAPGFLLLYAIPPKLARLSTLPSPPIRIYSICITPN